jgi:hypothetical protein
MTAPVDAIGGIPIGYQRIPSATLYNLTMLTVPPGGELCGDYGGDDGDGGECSVAG